MQGKVFSIFMIIKNYHKMKKLLLTGAMLMAINFGIKAQEQQIITSFEETEDAGYVVEDDIANYSDLWSTYSSATAGDADSGLITISDEWASDGTQSLKFAPVGNQADEANYAFGPLYNFTSLLGTQFDLTFDANTDDVSNSSSNMIYQLIAYDEAEDTQTAIAKVQFDYSGSIYVWDSSADQTSANGYGYVEATGFEANTTYTVNVRFNEDESISYLVNDEEVFNFTPSDTSVLTGYYYPAILTDDYDSTWYVDNITLALPAAAVTNPSLSQFAVYPNPAANVVNVSNAQALVNSVALTDINGRTVKTAQFNNVSDAQVNISDLATGVYIMTINSDKGTTTQKVVKE